MAGDPDLIKVRLTDRGTDSETPWAHDLGPAPGPPGSRKVRLANVPFMHAKPTWGDVIIVTPVEDDFPVWDRGGVPWEQITTRIAEDGGRWAMIVDYAAHPGREDAFSALVHACAENEIVCEGAWGPRDGKPGRAYLAVKHELDDVAVMKQLRAAGLPCQLIQIHPEPAGATPSATKPVATKPAATKPAATKPASKPVATKPAATKPASKPVATKPFATKPGPAKPAATKSAVTRPAATKSAVTRPAATKSAETRPAATKSAATRPAETRPAATNGSSTNGSSTKSTSKPTRSKAAVSKPTRSKGAASKPTSRPATRR